VGSDFFENEIRGFIDTNGNISIITLPFSNIDFYEGLGINDSGQVVGAYFTIFAHGFLDRNGVISAMDVPFSGAIATWS
jgi:hypothetical protein